MGFNARKDIEQTQTGVTWSKPINDQNELYAMAYLGNRQVTQYQAILMELPLRSYLLMLVL